MGGIDPQTALWITLVVLILSLIVFAVDVGIFVLWLYYRVEIQNARQWGAVSQPNPSADGSALVDPVSDLRSEWDEQESYALQSSIDLETGEAPDRQAEENVSESLSASSSLRLPRLPFAPVWSLVDPFVTIQAALGAQILMQIPLFFLGLDAMFKPVGLFLLISGLLLTNIVFVAAVTFFLRRYGSSLSEIGLRAPTRKQVLLGLGLGAGLFLLAAGVESGVTTLLTHISPHLAERLVKITEALTAGGAFDQIHNNGWKLAFFLAGAVAAPIGEEVFFRGFLYNALKRRWGIIAGIVLSGLAFALMHIGPLAVVIIFPMGMILAYVYERTRSLWVTIVMHMVNNGTAFLIAWFWPRLGH